MTLLFNLNKPQIKHKKETRFFITNTVLFITGPFFSLFYALGFHSDESTWANSRNDHQRPVFFVRNNCQLSLSPSPNLYK